MLVSGVWYGAIQPVQLCTVVVRGLRENKLYRGCGTAAYEPLAIVGTFVHKLKDTRKWCTS